MRLCLKIGGAQLEDVHARARLARAIANAVRTGHECLVVHGGGNQIRALSKRCGIEDRYHDGLRITDAETADIALAVLAGTVGKALAASLCEAGAPAVSLCGVDGNSFTAARHAPLGVDLGYVGKVARVDRTLAEALFARGFVPLFATVAALDSGTDGDGDHLYNINADHAAAPLAAAFGCDAVLFLTDVPGVLDAEKRRIARLSPAECAALRDKGVLRGGMIPKVDAALDALHATPTAMVKIAPADGDDAVLAALSKDIGTRFHVDCADEDTDAGTDECANEETSHG
ncbi:MAG: acetylglutamate kinase [Planctomycetota bacterium]